MQSLPRSLPFYLPEQAGLHQIEQFEKLSDKLVTIVSGSGESSEAGKQRLAAIKSGLIRGESVFNLIEDARDIRLLCFLMRTDSDIQYHLKLSNNDVEYLEKVERPWPNSTLRQLILLYFEYWDLIPGRIALEKLIHSEIEQLEGRNRLASDLKSYLRHRAELFTPDGPRNFLRRLQMWNMSLDQAAAEAHIPGSPPARFREHLKRLYYIETLKGVSVGADHSVLREVIKENVKNSLYAEELLLGHAVGRLLIERTLDSGERISELWLDILLSLFGDPRIPSNSVSYQKWWGALPEKLVRAVKGWLSGLDLKLFLTLLEQIGVEHDDTELQRMFPARKRLLEGLYDLGLIKNARLILDAPTQRELKNSLDREALPQIATLSGNGGKQLIYLELTNQVHVVEGTHNFSLRIFGVEPVVGLADFEKNTFSFDDFIYPKCEQKIPHIWAGGKPHWQKQFLEFLQKPPFSLNISPEQVLTPEHYQEYRTMVGMGTGRPTTRGRRRRFWSW